MHAQEIIEISLDLSNIKGRRLQLLFPLKHAFNGIHYVKYDKTAPLAFLKISPVINVQKLIVSAL